MERCVSIEVVVILQDGTTPVKYGLTMDMEDKCSAIPPRLARVCGVPPQHLVLVDIFQAQVRHTSLHCSRQVERPGTQNVFAFY